MSKTLIIAEKPSVATDLARVLSKELGKFEKKGKDRNTYFESEHALISSAVGLMLLFNLMLEDKDNILLIFLLIFSFSAYYIFQKYFEPMFFFIFFLMIKSSVTRVFLKDMKNIYFLFFYLSIYLTTAIINDIYKITKTVL